MTMTTQSTPEQSAPPASTTQLPLGASWYPELWPEDQWAFDVARMKEVGVTVVRLFEYAWHRFEPREWEYDFDWSHRVLDLLHGSGLKAVIATPTAAPPAWLTSKYPEVLGTDAQGRRGRRIRHPYSVVSARYREFCTRIVDQMVHSFRGHDAVLAWQIDSGIDGLEYGGEARRLFHVWLHERFGHIDQLNKAWGTELWGQAFEYFEQVPLPLTSCVHPSIAIAFQRFMNDQWGAFIQAQCETIRAGFDKPITINMTGRWRTALNWFRLNHLVDRVGVTFDHLFDLPDMLWYFDRMRGEKPGVSSYLLGAPTNRNAHALGWLAVLAGGDLVLFDRWRASWAGQEMGQGGIVTATGKWAAAKEPLQRLARECREQGAWLESHPPVEARLAIVVSHEANWAFGIDPAADDGFNYGGVWHDEFYAPIARRHYWRDVIDQTADFCPYHVIVMPLLPMVFRPTRDRLKQWVEEGGCLLLGPFTGHRTEELTAWTDQEFGGLEELMGATWARDVDACAAVKFLEDYASAGTKGKGYALTPTAGQALATFEDGAAAAVIHAVGQGTVITLGTRLDEGAYMRLVEKLCGIAKITPLASGSPDVTVLPAMNPDGSIAAYGLVNLSGAEQVITLPQGGRDRLSGREYAAQVVMPPREVLLIEPVVSTDAPAKPAG
jgi:beta-galactosidase GanA